MKKHYFNIYIMIVIEQEKLEINIKNKGCTFTN